MDVFGNQKPDISYPASWQFRLVGMNEDDIRHEISRILNARSHTISTGNTSSKGKYCSLYVELTVHGDEERHGYYHLFSESEHILYVL